MSALPAAARQIGVVTHSSGNHGQAVAYAAALLGMPAVVVVPDNAPAVKVAAIRELGAEIVVSAPSLAARLAATRDIATQRGAVSIPPFDDRRVIAGQGTIGLEIAADCPGWTWWYVPGWAAVIAGSPPRSGPVPGRDRDRRGARARGATRATRCTRPAGGLAGRVHPAGPSPTRSASIR